MSNLESKFFHQAAEAMVELARLRSEGKPCTEVHAQLKYATEIVPMTNCFAASAYQKHGELLYQIANGFGWNVTGLTAQDAVEGLAFKMAERNEQYPSS